jgi:hypothetical protein
MANMQFFLGWSAREYLWACYHALYHSFSLFHYSAHLVHYHQQQLLRQIYAAMAYIIFHIHIGDVGNELCEGTALKLFDEKKLQFSFLCTVQALARHLDIE